MPILVFLNICILQYEYIMNITNNPRIKTQCIDRVQISVGDMRFKLWYMAVSYSAPKYSEKTCAQFIIYCTLYNVHSLLSLHIVHCTMYTVQCTLYTVQFTLYTVHCTLYTVHCTLYTVHCTLYTVHCTVHCLL